MPPGNKAILSSKPLSNQHHTSNQKFALKVIMLQGLIDFLAMDPYYLPKVWSSLVWEKAQSTWCGGSRRGLGKARYQSESSIDDMRALQRGPYDPLLPLFALLRGVMLRRTKEDLGKGIALLSKLLNT